MIFSDKKDAVIDPKDQYDPKARLQQYVNRELPDIQAGFRKGRGTRDHIANIRWIMEKTRVPEKHLFLLY